MATLQASTLLSSSTSLVSLGVKIRANLGTQRPKIANISVPPKADTDLVDEFINRQKNVHGFQAMPNSAAQKRIFTNTCTRKETSANPKVVEELYAIMEVVADRAEMHKNIGKQRDNWNHLLLSSVNGMMFTAATLVGLAAVSGGGERGEAPLLALRLSSTILYVAATGVLIVMNKIQPSQLAEEQRNASRLCKQLHKEIKSTIGLRTPTQSDVNDAMEKVLALDRAYPLPLLGTMLNKFPTKVEPAVWWPKHLESQNKTLAGRGKKVKKLGGPTQYTTLLSPMQNLRNVDVSGSLSHENQRYGGFREVEKNGWSENLEEEMREVIGVLKKKDTAEYVKLSKMVLTVNKMLAFCGTMFTGLAAVGSAFVGSTWTSGSWPVVFGVVFGALATIINTLEHGGQVGMVFEMYRDSAGFFRLLEESIESNLRGEVERRENGQVFEAKVALELGRSVSELRDLASASSSVRNPVATQEFASKLF